MGLVGALMALCLEVNWIGNNNRCMKKMSFRESLTNGFLDRSLKIYIASAVTVFIFVITITINRVEKKIEGVDDE